MRSTRTFAAFVALVLVAGSCGNGDDAAEGRDDGPASTPVPATEPAVTEPPVTEPAVTEPPVTEPPVTEPPVTEPPVTEPPVTEPPVTEPPEAAGEIPEHGGGTELQPPDVEDITAGPVVVQWYRNAEGGNYVAVFTGPGIAGARASMGLCAGTALLPEYEHQSNAPTARGSCGGFSDNLTNLRACVPGVWIYDTLIPGDTEGTLQASLLWRSDEYGVLGLYGDTETSADMPVMMPGLSTYEVPPSFTPDGSTFIECFDTM